MNTNKEVLKSSLNAKRHEVLWYRQPSHMEHPWISLTNHHYAINNGDILYGGNGVSLYADVLEGHKGANVYIRAGSKSNLRSSEYFTCFE